MKFFKRKKTAESPVDDPAKSAAPAVPGAEPGAATDPAPATPATAPSGTIDSAPTAPGAESGAATDPVAAAPATAPSGTIESAPTAPGPEPSGAARPAPTAPAVDPGSAANPAMTAPAAEPVAAAQAQPDRPGPEAAPGQNPQKPEQSTDSAQGSGFFSRLKRGLGRTSDNLVAGLGTLFLGRKEIDEELLEELESRLLMADVGVEATMEIIDTLTQRVSRNELTSPAALHESLKDELYGLLQPVEKPLDVSAHKPYVILMVGVNGVGKTTTIGKLARRYQAERRSVMLAAGDTFRAAAVEQLQVWGERNNVPVVAQHTGADSASVLYDALQAAQARQTDVLIADTAGRLHNKDNLMEELKKVVRVLRKLDPDAPHEVMLVLDAGTGQNALAQADQFRQAVGVTGLALTKLDGTAKGGVIFAIARKLGLPIRYIGVGETAEDLRPFQARQFIDALFARDDSAA